MKRFNLYSVSYKLWDILTNKDVTAAKVWMAFFSFLYGCLLISEPAGLQSYGWQVLQTAFPLWVWGLVFVFQSIVAFYSTVMGVVNKTILIFDGALGTMMWSFISLIHSFSLGVVDPTIVGMILSGWLTIRIITEKEIEELYVITYE